MDREEIDAEAQAATERAFKDAGERMKRMDDARKARVDVAMAQNKSESSDWKEIVINGVRMQTMDVSEASKRWWNLVAPPPKEPIDTGMKKSPLPLERGSIPLGDPYLQYITEEPDPEEVTKKPSIWSRIFHTFFS